MDGDSLIHWTARLSLAFYALAMTLRMLSGARGKQSAARIAWTLGYALLLSHLAVAFHFRHGWRHDAAYEATARQTADAVGLSWGGGLYVNYVFALVWGLDVAWWWSSPASYLGRSRWIETAVQAFLAFIAFNAAVVFVDGAMRWTSLAVCTLLALLGTWTMLLPQIIGNRPGAALQFTSRTSQSEPNAHSRE
jgi:hypothetical protein